MLNKIINSSFQSTQILFLFTPFVNKMSSERDPLLQDRGVESNEPQDDQPNIEARESGNSGRFTFLEKVLFTLTALFFIVLCILAGLYARRVYDEKPHDPPTDSPLPPENNNTSVNNIIS